MYLIFKAFALLALIAVYVEAINYTNCNQLPDFSFDMKALRSVGPLKLLRSSNPYLKCTVGLLTGPIPTPGNTNYTFFLLQGTTVTHAFNTDPTSPATTSYAYTCNDGQNYSYKYLNNNLTGPNPYFITYRCDVNTGGVTLVLAYARHQASAITIDYYINQYLSNIHGGQVVFNTWVNCSTVPYCEGLFV